MRIENTLIELRKAGAWTAVKGTWDYGWRTARGASMGRDNHPRHGGVEVARVKGMARRKP